MMVSVVMQRTAMSFARYKVPAMARILRLDGVVPLTLDNTQWRHQAWQANNIRHISTSPPKHGLFSKDPPLYDEKKGELVYKGTLSTMVRNIKLFSLTTSGMGLAFQPYFIMQSKYSTALTVAVGTTMGFFILITPLLLHYITKKYVSSLYFKADTGNFTATTYNLFLLKCEHVFQAKDVKIPDIPGAFTSMVIGGKTSLFVDQHHFLNPQVYVHMVGYDKPFQWEAPPQDKDIKQG